MAKSRFSPVRTLTAWERLPAAKQDAHLRALDALSAMRRNSSLSLTQAARQWNTTPETVRKYVGTAIERGPKGRFIPRAGDRLFRPMHMLTDKGQITVHVTDSRVATRIARYMGAVGQRQNGKGDTALREFRGKSLRIQKVEYPFITNPRVLDRLANANEISNEDLYAR
jgi:hypothetical protein